MFFRGKENCTWFKITIINEIKIKSKEMKLIKLKNYNNQMSERERD